MLNRFAISAVSAVLGLTVAATAADAAPIRSGFDSNTLAANDDGSTGAVNIGFTVDFFGVNYSQLFVNNNGNVTFDTSLGTFTPFDLLSTSTPIIAPFFADVDTRVGNVVTYGTGTVNGRDAFGVNWIDVGYFSQNTDKLNSFQLVLTERFDTGPGNFDIEFNYEQIEWETGDFSGGTGGLGGNSARVGYSNGVSEALELTGSAVNGAFLDGGPNALISNSNIGVDGRYLFTAREGTVQPSAVPVPAALPLMLAGIGALGLARRAQRRLH
ncbi:MAG: nidogen-like domain-containing protein [Paracoccaceae bacterium]|jgi:hypothetical protein|nr:nidogen-like domain-containing protein [Paracoccaceae bacterium]